MTQRRFLTFGWIACLLLAAAGHTTRATELQRAPAEKHNIIFIVTDDQARWSIGAYGNREAITPNIDRLAREGAKFNNAFVTTPVCSPSRVALLTGRYGTEVGITDYLTPEEGEDGRGLPESAFTWPRALQQNGYRTALFGKYHLGTASQFHPTRRGFDYFMGSLQGSFAPVNPRLEVNGRMTDIKGAGSDIVMDDAIRWIEANRDEPFAALIHFREPHLPYTPMPDEDATLFKDLDPTIPDAPGLDRTQVKQFYRDYYAAVHAVDRNLGKLLALLQSRDLDRRTIVIFQSDHGYNIGQHGIHTKGNGFWIAGGVNGPKRPNMWDTSLRIPLIVRWPGTIEAGTEIDETVLNLDMFPSVLGLLKIKPSADYRHHGKDFTPLLFGTRDQNWRSEIFGQYDLHNLGLAYMRMLRTQEWKLVRHYHANGLDELYDLKNDPEEKKNLYRDPAHRETRAQLQQRLNERMKEIDDPLLLGTQVPAQQFPPGYVDPAPLLAAASREIGEANLKCITFSGEGYAGAVGQTFENAVNVDWPRIDRLANYTRTIDWAAGTSKETFDRKPGLNPASWKYGLGWQGGTPTQKATRQTHIVSGRSAWHIDGDGPPVAVPQALAELYQLDLWLNPPGFLKAARLPGANPVAFWRWEQIEKGRDGNVVQPEKVHVVAITMLGKYRVDATINSQNQITRIKTTVSEPALGDFNIEHESTNQVAFGNVKWPTAWHSHHGWDDNWQFYRQSTGHNGYGGTFPKVQPNVCGDPVPVPPSVAQATFPIAATVDKIAEGVYLLGGGPANSYMVEFRDFVAVFEAPGNEERSLAVIDAVTRLAPNKPIRWLVSSHPHFDHIGGLRTYLHIGATIIAHMKNIAFLNRDVLNYEPRTVAPDIVSRWPPTELSEGYTYEAVQENYVITDNQRILRIYYVQPLEHVEGMLMAYLPAERIVFEADLFDTHEPPRASQLPAMRSFANQVARMKLDVDLIAPVHGKPEPWMTLQSSFNRLAGSSQR